MYMCVSTKNSSCYSNQTVAKLKFQRVFLAYPCQVKYTMALHSKTNAKKTKFSQMKNCSQIKLFSSLFRAITVHTKNI